MTSSMSVSKNSVVKRFFKVIIPIVAIAAIVAAGYFYNQVRVLKQSPQAQALAEASDLTLKVGKLIVLPKGETPTVATVSDPAALKDQPFFALAQKGDKVLIYAQAKEAVLYSVTLNKILNLAPLNIGTQASVTPPAPKADTSTSDKKNP